MRQTRAKVRIIGTYSASCRRHALDCLSPRPGQFAAAIVKAGLALCFTPAHEHCGACRRRGAQSERHSQARPISDKPSQSANNELSTSTAKTINPLYEIAFTSVDRATAPSQLSYARGSCDEHPAHRSAGSPRSSQSITKECVRVGDATRMLEPCANLYAYCDALGRRPPGASESGGSRGCLSVMRPLFGLIAANLDARRLTAV